MVRFERAGGASGVVGVAAIVARSIADVQSALEFVAIVVDSGAATAFGSWWHDAHAIRAGKIEVDGGSEALMDFAPMSYFSMGATYAAVTLAAYRALLSDAGAIVWVAACARHDVRDPERGVPRDRFADAPHAACPALSARRARRLMAYSGPTESAR